jgi:hypothetical protein
MKLQLILEKGDDGSLWGRVSYGDDLITTSGATLEEVKANITSQLEEFGYLSAVDAKKITFEVAYDLTAFFEQYKVLNISQLAELAEVNPGLLRQYTSGVKHPSPAQALKIQEAVRTLGEELKKVSIYAE